MLKIDNAEVRARQLSKLQMLKGTRDVAAVDKALDALTKAALGNGNLLEFAIRAARAHATVGEISLALEKVFGRHVGDRSRPFPASTARNWAKTRQRSALPPRSRPSRRRPARARASSLPKWDRTATTAARRSSPPPSPTSASTSPSERCSRRPPRSRSSLVERRRPHRRRVVARRRPPDAHPRIEGRAPQTRPGRYPDRRRRRHPAAGLRRGAEGRRRGNLPARNGHTGGRRAAGGQAAATSRHSSATISHSLPLTTAISPIALPNSACAIGETCETLPFAASASSSPTIFQRLALAVLVFDRHRHAEADDIAVRDRAPTARHSRGAPTSSAGRATASRCAAGRKPLPPSPVPRAARRLPPRSAPGRSPSPDCGAG